MPFLEFVVQLYPRNSCCVRVSSKSESFVFYEIAELLFSARFELFCHNQILNYLSTLVSYAQYVKPLFTVMNALHTHYKYTSITTVSAHSNSSISTADTF